MKMTLEYEDSEAEVGRLASQVIEFFSEVDDIRDKIRNHLKYDQKTTLDDIYSDLCMVIDKYNLS